LKSESEKAKNHFRFLSLHKVPKNWCKSRQVENAHEEHSYMCNFPTGWLNPFTVCGAIHKRARARPDS